MQQRRSTFSVLFYIKRKKLLKNGDAPVYMRVTVDGRFLEASLKRGVNPREETAFHRPRPSVARTQRLSGRHFGEAAEDPSEIHR